MKLPRYSRYKPSGVAWLGDVPEHWEAKRLKNAASYWVSNVAKVAAENEVPIRLCNYTDVYYNDHIRPSMRLMETTASEEEVRDVAEIAFQIPSEIFQRRNLWGLELR